MSKNKLIIGAVIVLALIWGGVSLLYLKPVGVVEEKVRQKHIKILPAGYCVTVPEKCSFYQSKNKIFLYCEDGTGGEMALNMKDSENLALNEFQPTQIFDHKQAEIDIRNQDLLNSFQLEGRNDYFIGDLTHRNLYQVYILYKDVKKAFGIRIKKC